VPAVATEDSRLDEGRGVNREPYVMFRLLNKLWIALLEWIVWPLEDGVVWVCRQLLRAVGALLVFLLTLFERFVLWPLHDLFGWLGRLLTGGGSALGRGLEDGASALESLLAPVATAAGWVHEKTLRPVLVALRSASVWVLDGAVRLGQSVGGSQRQPVVLTLFFCAVVAAAYFAGNVGDLTDPAGIELAQTARNVAEARGLTTSAIRPLSLAVSGNVERHPDLVVPPAQAFATAVAFVLRRPSDRVAAAASGLFLVPTLWLVFLLGQRLGGRTVGFLASLAYVLSLSVLRGAFSGTGTQMAALLFTLWLYRMLPDLPPAGEDKGESLPVGPGRWPPKRLFQHGALFGLLMLADWHFACLWPVAVVVVWRHCLADRRGVAAFAAGLALLALPWGVRNARVTGSPLFSLHLYAAAADTETHPGDTALRALSPSSLSPLALAASDWQGAARRFGRRLLSVRDQFAGWLDFYLLGVLLVALLFPSAEARRSRLWSWLLLFMVCRTLVGCVFDWPVGSLLPFAPVALCLATAALVDVVAQGAMPADSGVARKRHRRPGLARGGVVAAVLVLAALPVLARMAGGDRVESLWGPSLAALKEGLPPKSVLLSDQPAVTAWYANCTVIGLPLTTGELAALETQVTPVTGIVLTPATAAVPGVEAPDSIPWRLLLRAPRAFAGYVPQRLPGGTVVYRKANRTAGVPSASSNKGSS